MSIKKSITLFFVMIFCLTLATCVYADEGKINQIDNQHKIKPILYYLLFTDDIKLLQDVNNLKKRINMTDEEFNSLRELALIEYGLTSKLKKESSSIIDNENLSIEQKKSKIKEMKYNEKVTEVLVNNDIKLNDILGDRKKDFVEWVNEWWKGEVDYRNKISVSEVKQQSILETQSSITSQTVYATQYNGYTSNEVALPDKYLKFANKGWDNTYPNPPYTVDIYSKESGSSNEYWVYGVKVLEVGPWNENDNYWDSSSLRRKFKDLPLGKPEAEAAYFDNYNGGKDEFGRIVTNPAGIDLVPGVASKLGMGPNVNRWVKVYYNDLP